MQAIESAELLHYGSASLRAADVGVVISRSGGSVEPVLLAEKMREAGMTVIAVTNVPGSTLEKIAHITLPIGSQADKLIAVQTYTGTVLTLLLLAEEVLSGESVRLSEACGAALPALSTHIDECLRRATAGRNGSWVPRCTCLAAERRSDPFTRLRFCCMRQRRQQRSACRRGNFATDQRRFSPAIFAQWFSVRPRQRKPSTDRWRMIFSLSAQRSDGSGLVAVAHPHWYRGRRSRMSSRRSLKSSPYRWRRTGSRSGAASLPAIFVLSPRSRPQSRVFLLPNNLHWRITDEITHTSQRLKGALVCSASAAFAKMPQATFPVDPRARIAVATYPFRAFIKAPGNSEYDPKKPGMDLTSFARFVRTEFKVNGIEPLNSHFTSTEPDAIRKLRAAFDAVGVYTVNIPVDEKVDLCSDDEAKRNDGQRALSALDRRRCAAWISQHSRLDSEVLGSF